MDNLKIFGSYSGCRTKIIFLVFFLSSITSTSQSFFKRFFPEYSGYKEFEKGNLDESQKILEKSLIEKPSETITNYNLGTIYYKKNDLSQAENSFKSALQNANPQKSQFLDQTHFNLGNCLYKKANMILGPNWESQVLGEEIITAAVGELQQSISEYDKSISIQFPNLKAENNKKFVERLLEKLLKNKDRQKQKKSAEKQEAKNQENSDQQNKKDDKSNQKQNQAQASGAQEDQSLKQEKQESIQESKIDREKNTIEAMLENVEAKEKDLQKEIIKNKMKQNEQKPESNQKPW